MNASAGFEALCRDYLGRSWVAADGYGDGELDGAFRKAGVRVPAALREYYLALGKVPEFNLSHNRLYPPDELRIESGYLLFMDENQDVVSWGIAESDVAESDPVVWQRNNTEPVEWISEDMRFSEFMRGMFAWYAENMMFETGSR